MTDQSTSNPCQATMGSVQVLQGDSLDLDRLMGAAHDVWAWAGPGDPDLDDLNERVAFMRCVYRLAAAYHIVVRDRERRGARDR